MNSDTFEFNRRESCGALFSPCRTWRYALWRTWDWRGQYGTVMFIGLNPSTADETQDDPTIRRCIRFAKDWGFGTLIMMNAYAFRATRPQDMKNGRRFPDSPVVTDDPVGPQNDDAFRYFRDRTRCVIAAWGVHCTEEREQAVCRALNRPVQCLGKTKAGRPKHPLYLRADTQVQLFWSPQKVTS